MSAIENLRTFPYRAGGPRVRAAAAARYGGNVGKLVADAIACHIRRLEACFNEGQPFEGSGPVPYGG
jgi:hypothetical protein